MTNSVEPYLLNSMVGLPGFMRHLNSWRPVNYLESEMVLLHAYSNQMVSNYLPA